MDDHLHIIVAGNKGKVLRLPFSRKKFCIVLSASISFVIILTIASFCSVSLYTKNRKISDQLVVLQEKLENSSELMAKFNRLTDKERQKLDQKVALLEKSSIQQATAFQQEKESLISTAIDELNERSEIMEKIISSIGIKLPVDKKSGSKNSGGPFIRQAETERDELIFKADLYLKTIQYLPLGKPVNSPITSLFGKREDPLNHESAFHTGIDFRGKVGDPIYATADGVVKKAFHNGGYGNYVLIDHGNGYSTSFSHMNKYVVRRGDRVERGQLIGQIGNSGRSTGPHLHYEITLDNKPINPYKFMKVAKLLSSPTRRSSEK